MWKIGTGILGVGSVVTGGVFLYKELSKPNTYSIKDLLSSKNPEKRLISRSTNGSSDEGKLYATAYKDHDKNPFSLKQAKPTSTPNGDENAPEEFMNKCESLSKEEVADEKDDRYRDVLQYCTRDTLVQDLILESGRVLLEDTGNDGSESGKDYRSVNIQRGVEKDVGELSDGNEKKNNDSTVSNDLKEKCKSKLSSKTGGKVDGDYSNVVKGCSKEVKK